MTARPSLSMTLGNPGHDDRLTVPGGPADAGKNRHLPEQWEKPYGFRAAFCVAGTGTK